MKFPRLFDVLLLSPPFSEKCRWVGGGGDGQKVVEKARRKKQLENRMARGSFCWFLKGLPDLIAIAFPLTKMIDNDCIEAKQHHCVMIKVRFWASQEPQETIVSCVNVDVNMMLSRDNWVYP